MNIRVAAGYGDTGLQSDSCPPRVALQDPIDLETTLQACCMKLLETNKTQETELRRLRVQDGDIAPDVPDKYWREYFPRPRPRDIAAMQAAGITGDGSGPRAPHRRNTRDLPEEEANPRQQRAARPDPLVVAGGGDTAAGLMPA